MERIEKACNVDLSDLRGIFYVPVLDICNRIDLNVEFCNLEHGKSGDLDLNKNVIRVNDNHSGQRNLFTIAHEIGHFIIKKEKGVQGVPVKNRFDDEMRYTEEELREERAANKFAANLLMPADIFREKFMEYKQDFLKLSEFFKSSKIACEYRALNLGLSNLIFDRI